MRPRACRTTGAAAPAAVLGGALMARGCVLRAELRQYLDEGGVLDAWSKCLTALYQEREKPENPIE